MTTTSWGLYDSRDNCWLGNGRGPKTYDDYNTAFLAGMIVAEQLQFELNRLKIEPYDGTANQKKDDLPTLMDGETALGRLESGATLPRLRTTSYLRLDK